MRFEELPDVISSLHSLVKRNQGLFKSPKQAAFLTARLVRDFQLLDITNAGITPEEGLNYASWTGWMNWADYGRRGVRSFGWVFAFDSVGVVKVWKLAWQEMMHGGMELNPAKVKVTFERDPSLDVSELKAAVQANARAAAAEEAKSEFVGEVGKTFEGVVEVVSTFVSHAGYYGPTLIVGMKDENGNKLVWFSSSHPEGLERGHKVHIKGRVKKHEIYRDSKQTVLTRCRVGF